MSFTTLVLLLLEINSICALRGYDLQYCDDPTSIDKIEPLQEFQFEMYMDDFYYAIEGYKKSLACCAPKGSQIQWLFEGRTLHETNSSFHVLRNDSRYIISPKVIKEDLNVSGHGTYTCIVNNNKYEGQLKQKLILFKLSNETINELCHRQNIHGHVINVKPKQMVTIRSSQLLGFKSKNDLSNITVEWISNSPDYDKSYLNSRDVKKTRIYEASGGSAIMISLITFAAEKPVPKRGIKFECFVKYKDGALFTDEYGTRDHQQIKILPYKDDIEEATLGYKIIIVSILIFVASIVVIFSILIYYQIEIRLTIKDKFGVLEDFDGKENDVFVYSNYKTTNGEDPYCMHAIFVHKMLVPHLENILGYSCYNFLRDMFIGEWVPYEFQQKLKTSRRFILMLCDGLLDDPVCKQVCQDAVNEALNRKLPIICILPKNFQRKILLEKCRESNSAMHLILSTARKVTWPGKDATSIESSKFWKTLSLYMPPRRENLYLKDEKFHHSSPEYI